MRFPKWRVTPNEINNLCEVNDQFPCTSHPINGSGTDYSQLALSVITIGPQCQAWASEDGSLRRVINVGYDLSTFTGL